MPIDDLVAAIDNAIAQGYTVAWDGDVSERGFSRTNGLAILPKDPGRRDVFKVRGEELAVDQKMRQSTLGNRSTTDDHLMHLVGIGAGCGWQKILPDQKFMGRSRQTQWLPLHVRTVFAIKNRCHSDAQRCGANQGGRNNTQDLATPQISRNPGMLRDGIHTASQLSGPGFFVAVIELLISLKQNRFVLGIFMRTLSPNYVMIHCLIVFSMTIGAQRIQADEGRLPNILLILADDLGYGDVGCYNPQSRIPTPNINRLASQGMKFSDAHSPSTVCTPTRYSLLTGRMAFRTGMRGVFDGVGGPCLIQDDRLTLPAMLRQSGYATACIGKWHIGMTFFDSAGNPINQNGLKAVERIDFSKPIEGGPVDRGFDSFFGTASCPTTDWLYAYIDQNRVPVPPTGLLDKTRLPQHPYSRDNRRGRLAPDFDLETVDLVFLEKSKTFLRDHVATKPDQPFFLFHSTQAVHLPSFAAPELQGKTDAGPHGDFIFELDFVVGELLKTLEEIKVADNTLVIFTSDNGPEVPTTIAMRRDHQHDGAHPWRGVKRDQWEGGHRVPFIARWPGKISAGSNANQTICLTDLLATAAAITEFKLPNNAGEDSFNFLPTLLGSKDPVREYTLHQTISLVPRHPPRRLEVPRSPRLGRQQLQPHRRMGHEAVCPSREIAQCAGPVV